MTDFLAFTLYAPLASFGSLAVGERRETWDRPAKSAVLGLVGAALGIERSDDSAQRALADGYGFAARTDRPGRLLADYHTAQTTPTVRGKRYATRREELLAPRIETILSRRDYRTDALHTALLWGREGARWPLGELARALRQPEFTLYLGRKSCPLGLPLAPRLVEAATVVEAFARDDAERAEASARAERGRAMLDALLPDGGGRIASDVDPRVPVGRNAFRRERRRDHALVGAGRRFGLRDELVLSSSDVRDDAGGAS